MSKHLTPLDVAIALVAPLKDLGRIAGAHEKGAYAWRCSSAWRAAGDMPPRVNRALLSHSEKHGLGLTPDHLIWGASAEDVAAILAARPVAQERAA